MKVDVISDQIQPPPVGSLQIVYEKIGEVANWRACFWRSAQAVKIGGLFWGDFKAAWKGK